MPFKDLREFMELLEKEGELVRIKREVDPVYGVAAGIRKTSDIEGPALLFEKVKGSEIPALGGLFAKRKRALMALQTTEEKVLQEFSAGMRTPVPPRVIEGNAPCQEIVYTGNQIDLTKLPICTFSKKDGGPYITTGIQIARDPEYGYNLAIHRCMLKGKNRLTVFAPEYQHLRMYYSRAEARGEPLEMAIAIGVPPEVSIASQIKGSIDLDEMACAGGLRKGIPVGVVRCKTIDLLVPATAEIIIEGKMPPQVREPEGPFGEVTGYYGPGTESPVLEVSAITMRKDPIYETGLTGKPITDNHVLRWFVHESILYEQVKKICPSVKQVHITGPGACLGHAVISINQTYKDQAKEVIYVAFSSGIFLKHVVVVDEDIDVFNRQLVEWAIAYRVKATEDVLVLPKVRPGGAKILEPGAGAWGEETGSWGIGIDATRPFGVPFAEVVKVPGAEEFQIP